jgi:hypothetical protein
MTIWGIIWSIVWKVHWYSTGPGTPKYPQMQPGGSEQEDAVVEVDPGVDGPTIQPGTPQMQPGGSEQEDAIVEADAPDVDGPEGYQYLLQVNGPTNQPGMFLQEKAASLLQLTRSR